MSPAFASITALMLTVLFMVGGNGILGTMVPLRAKMAGFEPSTIGLLGSAYFGGMLVGAMLATRLLQKIGHVRALAAGIALATCTALVMALDIEPWVWLVLRFIYGFAFAALYAAIESWLHGKSTDAIRGRVLAIYSVMQFGGWAISNQIIGLTDPTTPTLFSLAAIGTCIAILPLMLMKVDPPAPPESARLDLVGLWRHSPIGVVGALLIGMVNGPFWSMTPVFASDSGFSIAEVGTFMTMLTAGAAVLQIPIGRWSDGADRRMVLISVALGTAAIELSLGLLPQVGRFSVLLAIGFVLGGLVSTQYYIVAAHANDRAAAADIVRISAALLLLYCIGAVIGPSSAALVMQTLGPKGLFLHNGVLHVILVGFVIYRMLKRAPPARPADVDTRTFRPSL